MEIKRQNSLAYYEGDVTPGPGIVFVFGSNPEGRHGAGAAKVAADRFGAVYGQGEGLQGNAYALPTKDLRVRQNNGLRSYSPEQIMMGVKRLYATAREHPDRTFCVAYRNVDTMSLNGYTGREMMTIFADAGEVPPNVAFSKEWMDAGLSLFSPAPERRLQAPDGSPSNLSPALWDYVRSASFIARHGDWRHGRSDLLLDGHGEPQLLWHGTAREFGEFSLSHAGDNTGITEYTDRETGRTFSSDSSRALFFTDNRLAAVSYGFLGWTQEVSGRMRDIDFLADLVIGTSDIKSSEMIRKLCERVSKDTPEAADLIAKITVSDNPPFISMTDEERKTLNGGLRALEKSLDEIYSMGHKFGTSPVSNQLNNLSRQVNYLDYFRKNLDRLRANDLTVKAERLAGSDADLTERMIRFYDERPGHRETLVSADSDDGNRIYVSCARYGRVPMDTLSDAQCNELVNDIADGLNANIDDYEKKLKDSGYAANTHLRPVFLKMKEPSVLDFEGSSFTHTFNPDPEKRSAVVAALHTEKAAADGCDGVIYRNVFDPFEQNSYGVFSTDGIVDLRNVIEKENLEITIPRATTPMREAEQLMRDLDGVVVREDRGTVFSESPDYGYRERTIENARRADVTLALAVDFGTAGERLTKSAAGMRYVPVTIPPSPASVKDPSVIDSLASGAERAILDVCRMRGCDPKSLSVNMAGNGIYTLDGHGISQEAADSFVLGLLQSIEKRGRIHFSSVRSGGQTGIDEAGVKAGRAMGLPTEVLAPKGWKFRDRTGRDICGEVLFKARFGVSPLKSESTAKEAVSGAPKQKVAPELIPYVEAARKARDRGEITRASNPHDGWCVVQNAEGKYNYMNKDGKYITGNAWFDSASAFCDGKATVIRGDTVAVIDAAGTCLEVSSLNKTKTDVISNPCIK